jgi:hypothetical protein
MKSVFLGVILLGSIAHAALSDCTKILTHYDDVQVSRDYWQDTKTCYVSIHPMSVTNLIYRDYMITSDGYFMVFNSYSESEDPTATGAREFYFFPRKSDNLQVTHDAKNEEVVVKMTDDLSISFDTKTAEVKKISKGQVQVASSVNPNNNGGVEILKFNGLMLDAGFALGHSPSERATAKSVFIDENGQSCSVTNKEIFNYTNGNVRLKYNDAGMKTYLSKSCPQLKLSF